MLERLQLPPWSPCPPLWSRRASWFGEVQLRRGQRRGRQKMPSGEKQQEESCPHLRQGELLQSPAHLRARVSSGWAGGRCRAAEPPLHRAERGAGAGTGRKGGLVTRRDITNNFFSLPRGCRCSPSPQSRCAGPVPPAAPQHPPHGTGQPDSAPSGSPQAKGRSRERYARLKPQHREPRQESRFGNKQPLSITTAGRNTA